MQDKLRRKIPLSLNKWEDINEYERPSPRLTVYFDLGWKKFSTGNLYRYIYLNGITSV